MLNFSFPLAVFLHCCDRGFILLCLQDSEVEFLSSPCYKDLHKDNSEGKSQLQKCLNSTWIFCCQSPSKSAFKVLQEHREWQATRYLLRQATCRNHTCAVTPAQRATALTNTTLFKAAETGESCPDGKREKQQLFLKYFVLLRLLDLSNIVLRIYKPKIFLETYHPTRLDTAIVSRGGESATDDGDLWSPRERLVHRYSHKLMPWGDPALSFWIPWLLSIHFRHGKY